MNMGGFKKLGGTKARSKFSLVVLMSVLVGACGDGTASPENTQATASPAPVVMPTPPVVPTPLMTPEPLETPSSGDSPQPTPTSTPIPTDIGQVMPMPTPNRYGDYGLGGDASKLDDPYWGEKMARWSSAGVRGGIPFLSKIERENIEFVLESGADSDAINSAIHHAEEIVAQQNIDENGLQPDGRFGGVAIFLKNGVYQIDKPIQMKSRVYLVGESRDGVIAKITIVDRTKGDQPLAGTGAFWFGPGTRYAGIYRLTIQGGWGKPEKDWNDGADVSGDNYVASVYFFGWQTSRTTTQSHDTFLPGEGSSDHFLDQVNIYDAYWHPVRNDGEHITFRDIDVDGVHMKGGGAEGYFFILNGHNLITGSHFTHLRHFSIQSGSASHNVVVDNLFHQEISFHTGDDGQNLIEANLIHLPEDMPSAYYCVMGIWSNAHMNSLTDNYLWNNECIALNHGGELVFNDNVVYEGPAPTQEDGVLGGRKSGDQHNRDWYENTLVPIYGTLYPVNSMVARMIESTDNFHTINDHFDYVGNNDPLPDLTEDQCDTTAQCRVIWPQAIDCADSRSDHSVCVCGGSPCVDLGVSPTPAPSLVPAPTPAPTPDAAVTPMPPSTIVQRVGDPEVTFNLERFDPDWPQMREWQKAGVRNGIPYRSTLEVKATLHSGGSEEINAAIRNVANQGGGAVYLKNGAYDISGRGVKMKSHVYLIGQSRDGVVATVNMDDGIAFDFGADVHDSGIYTLTITGGWGEPTFDWNYGRAENEELPGNDNTLVRFKGSIDTFLDGVNLYNAARHPLWVNASHTTLRDLDVRGVHNKSGGAQGYFFIGGPYNLVTGTKVTQLRHFTIQGERARYNVVYKNNFKQEISFHVGDGGDNLVEANTINLPPSMPPANGAGGPGYVCIMGPWSTQHTNSLKPNYLYKNRCHDENQGGRRPWSDDTKMYYGPREVKPDDHYTNFPEMPDEKRPLGGTLYPVIAG